VCGDDVLGKGHSETVGRGPGEGKIVLTKKWEGEKKSLKAETIFQETFTGKKGRHPCRGAGFRPTTPGEMWGEGQSRTEGGMVTPPTLGVGIFWGEGNAFVV